MKSSKERHLPLALTAVPLVVALLSAPASDHPELTIAAGGLIALTVGLLWRLGEPPALLFAATMQIAQVITPLIYSNLAGAPLVAVSEEIGDISGSTWFGIAAVSSLVVGMWIGQLGGRRDRSAGVLQDALAWSPEMAFRFCIVTVLIGTVFDTLAWGFGGLTQIFLAASTLQWIGVFVLTAVCISHGRGYWYFAVITILEIVKGFTGFFGGYKDIFFVLVLTVLSVRPRLRPSVVLSALAAVIILVTLGSFWSEIKTGYRSFLNQGTGDQIVSVSLDDRLNYLADRVSNIDGSMMSDGFEKLVERLGYVDFLAATIRHVPRDVPFQNGQLISNTVYHVLHPRLLFPDKPPLPSDTAITAKYTGIPVDKGSAAANVSISIGYVGELYIDFGYAGAIIGSLFLGLLFGFCFRIVCFSGRLPTMLNFSLAVILMIPVAQFEQALAKTVGVFLTTFLTILCLRHFVLPEILKWHGPVARAPARAFATPGLLSHDV